MKPAWRRRVADMNRRGAPYVMSDDDQDRRPSRSINGMRSTTLGELNAEPVRTQAARSGYRLRRGPGVATVRELVAEGALGDPLPVRERYACLWTTLGTPAGEIFVCRRPMRPTAAPVICGWVKMRTSGLRLVENFLDMAHFPYIHTDVLGAEPHTEVPHYSSEIRRDVDEVWATNCQFYQPQIVANRPGGMVQLSYRVPSPFVVMLYRVMSVSAQPARRHRHVHPAHRGSCVPRPAGHVSGR